MSTSLPDSSPTGNASGSAKTWKCGTLTYTVAGLVALFTFMLLGDFAWALKERGIQGIFKKVLGSYEVSDTFFSGLYIAVPMLITVIVGPFIGVISDRYRGRLGRRIPFLIASTPVIGVSIIGLAFSPMLGEVINQMTGAAPGSRTNALICLSFFWVTFEVATIVGNAMFIALVNDVVPRAWIGRFYGLFRIFSLLTGILFYKFGFKHAGEHHFEMFIGVAVIYSAGFGLLCWKIREGEYPPPEPLPKRSLLAATKAYGSQCFTSGYYWLMFLVIAMATAAFVPINTFDLKAAGTYQISDESFGNCIVITYICSLLLAFPIGWLTDKLHPMRTGLIAISLYAISMLMGYFFVNSATSYEVFFVLHGVLSGAFFTSTAGLALMLMPRSKFSQFASASQVVVSVVSIGASLGLGRLLDLLGNNYQYLYMLATVLACLSVGGWILLFRHFKHYGGFTGYVAPGEDPTTPPTTAPAAGH